MRTLLLGLMASMLAMLGTPASASPGWQSSTDSNRFPNNSDKYRFPRWLPMTLVDVTLDANSTLRPKVFGAMKMSVDSRNVVHLLGRDDTSNTAYQYYSSAHDSRKAGGFSDAEQVVPSPDTIDSANGPFDMATGAPASGSSDKRDLVHLVYRAQAQASGAASHDLYYRRRTPSSGWGSRTNLTNTSDGAQQYYDTWYGSPAIAVDASGVSHIVASYWRRYTPPPPTPPTETKKIFYITVNQAGALGSPSYFEPANYDLNDPQIRCGTNVHLMWLQYQNPTMFLKHAVNTGGTWSYEDVTSGTGATIPQSPDFTVDVVTGTPSRDDLHFVWIASDKVKYKKYENGQYQGVEDVSTLTTPNTPKIAVDPQHQPHVVWYRTADGKFCYAGRVNNENKAVPDWTGRQEPSKDFEDFGDGQLCHEIYRLAVNKNGGLFVLGANERYNNPPFFTRSIEYNLGEQDSVGMIPAGPGARANLVNGNLLMNFQVFSSLGAGLATNLNINWNSQQWESSPISQGWSHNYNIYLVDSKCGVKDTVKLDPQVEDPKATDYITLFMGDGRSVPFKWKDIDTNNKYHVALDEFGYFARIERDTPDPTTTYTLTTKHGVIYRFRSDGRLLEIEDTNGNKETLAYSSNRLSSITDTVNRGTSFTYDAEGKLDEITKNGVKHKFEYDTTKKLSKLTINNEGNVLEKPVWQFEYHTTDDRPTHKKVNLISKVTTPYPAGFLYGYYQDNRFEHSQDPTPSPSSIGAHGSRMVTYKDPIEFAPPPADQPRAEYTDRRSNLWKFIFESRKGLVTKTIDPLGKTVNRQFNDNYRNLTQITDQENNVTTFTYTYQAGTQELPTYIKDNVRTVMRPDPNAVSGGQPASASTAVTYTYVNNYSAVASLQTPNPAGSGSVTRSFARFGNGNLQTLGYPGTTNRVTNAGQNPSEGFTYDNRGEIATATRPRGGVSSITSDPTTGLPWTVQEPAHGSPTSLQYNNMGFVTQSTAPMGGITMFFRDPLNRLKEKHDPTGDAGAAVTKYKYDLTTGQITEIELPNGGKTVNQYDQLGRLVQTAVDKTSGTSLTTTYRYDAEGNLKEITDPRNNVTTNTFNPRNEMTQSVHAGSGDLAITTSFGYTDAGHLASRTTGGNQTSFVNSPWGFVKTRTYPITTITDAYAYSADGSLQSVVRNEGGTFRGGVQFTYDEIGRLCGQAQMASGGSGAHLNTVYGLDLDGNVTEVKDPAGRIYSGTYDLAGRLTDAKNATGTVVSHRDYDDNDRVTEIKGINPALGAGLIPLASYTYNSRNEVKTAKDSLLNTTQYTYKIGGEVDVVTDPGNKTTKYDYNLLSQCTTITRDQAGLNLVTLMDYDGSGNLASVTDPRLKQTTYAYSSLNRLKSITYPGAANSESWVFDSKGRPITHNGRRGITTTYSYDPMDRVTGAQSVQNSTTIGNVLSSYDGASNVTEMLDTVSQVSHTAIYDVFGRPTTKQIVLGRTGLGSGGTLWKGSSYTYKPDSQVDEFTDPQGTVFKHSYESQGNGRLQTIEKTLPGPAKTYVTYFHDAAGRRTEALFANAVATFWDYDTKGRIAKVRSVDTAGKILSSFGYTYNSRDERTTLLLSHLSTTVDYTYDAVSRLLTEAWSGNGSGNGTDPFSPTMIPGIPGNESPLTPAATVMPTVVPTVSSYSATYGYDGSGNRNSRQVLFNSITTNYAYAYDDESRLTTETVTGGTNQTVTYGYGTPASSPNILTRTIGATVETYSYDYADRLTGYLRNGASPQSFSYQYLPTGERLNKVNLLLGTNNEEWYYPDGPDVAADYQRTTGSGTYALTSTYVNGPGLDSKAARIQASGAELYYLVDALSGVHRVIDQAQAVQNTVLTTAWGEALPGFNGGVAVADRYGFTQRENDGESGLMHFRARAYDPRIARFIQTDPIIGNRPLDHYAYASNNPISRIDPMGLQDATAGPRPRFDPEAARREHLRVIQQEHGRNKTAQEYIDEKMKGSGTTTDRITVTNASKHLTEDSFREKVTNTSAGQVKVTKNTPHVVAEQLAAFILGLGLSGPAAGGIQGLERSALQKLEQELARKAQLALEKHALKQLDEVAALQESLRRAAGGLPEEEMAEAGVVLLRRRTFPNLKDHATRHAEGLTRQAYLDEAIAHSAEGGGRRILFRHSGETRAAFISRVGPDSFKFTSTSESGGVIFTHMRSVTEQYLRNIGITLPRGF